MKASVLFLIVFFTAVFAVFLIRAPSVSILTGSTIAAKEAHLTVESFYIYVILLVFAVIVCAVIWHFNKFFDREEGLRKPFYYAKSLGKKNALRKRNKLK